MAAHILEQRSTEAGAGAISSNTRLACFPSARRLYGPCQDMTAWHYNADGKGLTRINHTSTPVGSSANHVYNSGIDEYNYRLFSAAAYYTNMYSINPATGSVSYLARSSGGYGVAAGHDYALCHPNCGRPGVDSLNAGIVVANGGGSLHYHCCHAYTPAGFGARAQVSAVGHLSSYSVINRAIFRYFSIYDSKINTYQYGYTGAPNQPFITHLYTSANHGLIGGGMEIDVEYGFLISLSSSGVSFLKYNSAGQIISCTSRSIPYAANSIVVDTALKVIVFRKTTAPYKFYTMSYDRDGVLSGVLAECERGTGYWNEAIDNINHVFGVSDHNNADFQVALYKYAYIFGESEFFSAMKNSVRHYWAMKKSI